MALQSEPNKLDKKEKWAEVQDSIKQAHNELLALELLWLDNDVNVALD